MTQILNANKKEKLIISKRLLQSKLQKHVLKVIVIDDFTETYYKKHYPNIIVKGNKQEHSFGFCITFYNINKCDILMSSDNFISKIKDIYPYIFDNIFCHELGHVNHKHHHIFDKILKSMVLPKPELFDFEGIAHEIYADSFRNFLLNNKRINQKEILNNAITKIGDLREEYYHLINLGEIPTYSYSPQGFAIIPEDFT